ncbi:ester cyclase [Histomonas meleagridis]|uniref:ester cyclase n=1 Tax=Histomonas meleagridis TaxID=135588 RepID=UPI0035598162|nr:ester cyclase [Histomonas meleagridis]KAH0806782.1 ester cyclase [Histomonas meleagridis]
MEKFLAFINSCDPVLAKEAICEDAIFYAPTSPEPLRGPEGYVETVKFMRSGFSDIQWAIIQSVKEGDKIAVYWSLTGTHDGTFMGVPPTGRKIQGRSMCIYEFKDGKILKETGIPDIFGILQQIGGIPSPQ